MTGPEQVPADLAGAAIEDDPVVKQALGRLLLNVRALAREIQRSSKTEATLESIVSAVRRYPVEDSANRAPMGELIAKLALRDKVTAIGIIYSGLRPRLLAIERTFSFNSFLPARAE